MINPTKDTFTLKIKYGALYNGDPGEYFKKSTRDAAFCGHDVASLA